MARTPLADLNQVINGWTVPGWLIFFGVCWLAIVTVVIVFMNRR